MSSYFALLEQAVAPWWFAVDERSDGLGSIEAELQRRSAAVVRTLRGASMRSLEDMFEEIGSALAFPEYFGRNWPALDECLADLSWLAASAYVLLVRDSLQILAEEESGQFEILLGMLGRVASEWAEPVAVGEAWDRPAVPFHVVFGETNANANLLRTRFIEAGFDLQWWPLV